MKEFRQLAVRRPCGRLLLTLRWNVLRRASNNLKPLESLGLTPREAEVLLWVVPGKGNADVATILGCAENAVKVHLARTFDKAGFENRNAATVRALEVLSRQSVRN